MKRSLMLHASRVVVLWCFLLATNLAASSGSATDTDISGDKRLNNRYDFVDTNAGFYDVIENSFKSYLFSDDDLSSKGIRMTELDDHINLVDDNVINEKAPGNLLTFTNVNGNDSPTYVTNTNSFVDFTTLMEGQNIADGNYVNGIKLKTSTNPTKIIPRQQVTHQKQDTGAWMTTTGKWRSHDNQTHHHDVIREGSTIQRQRDLQSCVSTTSGLARAVKQASTTQSSSIKVCAPRISMGSLNRRRRRRSRRHLQSSSFNGTNVTIRGLAGGIDLSNRSITFQCLLKQRCILDGEGISRIFYGTNAIISISGFQFLNASSLNGDALGSGSALTLIGSSQVIISDSSFVYNTAPSVGGAIMINNSTLTLKSSRRKTRFLKNEATYGGAIFGIHATIQTNVTSSASSSSGIITFQDNYANHDGGAIYVMNSTVVCNQIILEKNDAANGGAAMFVDTNVTMTNLYVSGNEANVSGGAFVFLRSNVVLKNSTFDSNNGNGTVEAITSKSSSVQVTDSKFRRSSWYVGSSILSLTNTCLPQASNCVLGSSCNHCCKPYISWSIKVGYYCGPDPHNVKKCFGSDGTELKSAVANYSSGSSSVIANLTNIYGNISDWCTSSVTDWSYTFYGQSSCNENISNWDTSNATTMASMFYQASSFNQDISKWDTSKVMDMNYMFCQADSFNQDISKWDTSKVQFMNGMFYSADSFNLDISKWDTSKVTDMSEMFGFAHFNQDISSWDTSKVTDMSYMFFAATNAFNQNISKWDTSKVTDMSYMFNNNKKFNGNITMWNVSQVTNMNYMFLSAVSFNQDISGWDISKVASMDFMIFGATVFNQNLCAWKNKCPSIVFPQVFKSTSCPNQNDPICGIGPFCYTCP